MELQNFDNSQTMSSREIAHLTGKEHKNVLADCDKLNESYKRMGLAEISAGVYLHPNTGSQQHREMLLNKMQTMDLMTGYSVELRIKVNRRWEELENKNPAQTLSRIDLARMVIESEEENQRLQLEIKENAPLVVFAKALQISEHNILIGELAKILKQNQIEIGQNRLFDWLRDHQYLIRKGEQRNLPTQKSLELGLFEVKTTTINNPDGSVRVTKTTKVTPKGQEYFINKFIKVA